MEYSRVQLDAFSLMARRVQLDVLNKMGNTRVVCSDIPLPCFVIDAANGKKTETA